MEVAVVSCSGDNTNTVSIWNPFNATLLSSYHGGGNCTGHGVAVSGGYIFANEKGKPMIHAWPLNKPDFINKRLIAPGKISCIAISPDTTYIAVGVDSKLHVYQVSSGLLCGISAQHFQPLTIIKFNGEGTLIGCGGEDGLITVWILSVFVQKGASSPSPYFSVHSHSLPVTDLFFTSGNLKARLVSSSLDHTFKMYDLSTQAKLYTGVFEYQLTAMTLSPNESCFFIGNSDGFVQHISLISPPRNVENHYLNANSKDSFKVHEKNITTLSCSLDCLLLLSGSLDQTIKLTHIKSRQCLHIISQKGTVTNCFFYVPPKSMLTNSFKPSVDLNDFVNNTESLDYYSFDIFVNNDVEPFDRNVLNPMVDSQNSTNVELDKLKNINHDLFTYAVHTIFKKGHKHQITNHSIESDETEKTQSLKTKKGKKRKINSK